MTQHSKIVQRRITRPMDALTAFDEYGPNGEIPVVLVPRWSIFFSVCVNIPSGVFVLWQRFLSKKGQHPPGFIPCWPAWNRVSHIVTKATKTYNAPVKNCPTSDNVMVSVDVSVMFQIQDAETFVYQLGAERFDELMSAQTDEAIRGLVRAVKAMRVLDLREEFATGMLQGLNKKINPYGVAVLNVKITHVELPAKLAQTLENTTSFQTQMEQQEKKHQAEMRVLYDDAEITLTGIRKNNERKVQDIKAQIQRQLIHREEQMLSAQAQFDVAVVDTNTDVAVEKTQATSQMDNAKADGKKQAVEQIEKVKVHLEAKRITADQELIAAKLRCQARIEEAKAVAEALKVNAEVEEASTSHLMEERKFKLEHARVQAMKKMALNGKLVIGGETGETLLRGLSQSNAQAASTQAFA